MEKDGQIGQAGTYSLAIDAKGVFEVKIGAGGADKGLEGGAYVKGDVIILLEELAKHTENSVDDELVGLVKAALGRA